VRPDTPHTLHSLTSTRFFAAMWVLMMHFASVGALGPTDSASANGTFLRFWLATGGSAVGFFFVLSGFILAHTYHQRLHDNTPTQRLRFWHARVARIYPNYLLALGLTTASAITLGQLGVQPWSTCTLSQCAGSWLLSLVPLQSWFADSQIQQLWNAPGWSIATEAFFYALFPWLLRPTMALARRWGWWSIGIFWLLQNLMFAALSLYTTQASPELQAGLTWWQERLPLLRLPEFLMGISVWTLYNRQSADKESYTTPPSLRTGQALMLIAALIFIWYLPAPAVTSALRIPLSGKAYLLAAPLFATLIYWLATTERQQPEKLSRLLSSPTLITLGQASYALYIIHWFGLQSLFIAFNKQGQPPVWAGYLTVMLLVGGSLLVHRWFERPMQVRLMR
jgi:peptidoglycan/LPS O-acetylase OafA/YrhL